MSKLNLEKKDGIAKIIIKESGSTWENLISKSEKILIENLEIKGFRKGKIPVEIAKKHISENTVWQKASDFLLEKKQDEIIKILGNEKIVSRPISKIVSVSNESVEIVVEVTLMPEIKIGDRSKIKVEYKVDDVADSEIEKEIEQLDNILKKDVEINDEKATAKMGNTVLIDFLGKVDDKTFEGGEAKNHSLELGSKKFIGDFEEQIVGMKKNESKDVKVTFPDEYPVDELKGKNAVFNVKLNSIIIKEKLKGEELSEKLKEFGFSSREEIIKRIKEFAKERKISMANETFFRKYTDEILKLNDTKIIVPENVLEQEIDSEFDKIKIQIEQQGMKLKDYFKMLNTNESDFKKDSLREASLKRIKDGLIYQQLIDDLDIKVEEKDLESEYEKIASDSNIKVEDAKKQIPETSIKANVLFKKLINTIRGEK